MAVSEARARSIVDALEGDLSSEQYRDIDPEAGGYIREYQFAPHSRPTPVLCAGRSEWAIYEKLDTPSGYTDFRAVRLHPRTWFGPKRDYMFAGRTHDMRVMERTARVLACELLESRLKALPDIAYWTTYCLSLAVGAAATIAVTLSYPGVFDGPLLLLNMLFWMGLAVLVGTPLRTWARGRLEERVKAVLAGRLARDLPDEAEHYRYGHEVLSEEPPREAAAAAGRRPQSATSAG